MLNLTDLNFFAGIALFAYDNSNHDSYLNDSIYEYFSVVNIDETQPKFVICPDGTFNLTD